MASPLQDLIKQIQDLATDVGNLFQLRGFKAGGTAGQVPIKTNGTDFNWSWGSVSSFPDQTGNNGKFLTTNGTAVSWATVDLSTYATTAALAAKKGIRAFDDEAALLAATPEYVGQLAYQIDTAKWWSAYALGTGEWTNNLKSDQIIAVSQFTGPGTGITGLPLTTGVTGTLPIANGGTGGATAAAAWTALGGGGTIGSPSFTAIGATTPGTAVFTTVQLRGSMTVNSNVAYDLFTVGTKPNKIYAQRIHPLAIYLTADDSNGATLFSPSDGVIRITNYATNNFSRLQFGGTTSSFAALQTSGTTITAGLADGTAGGSLVASGTLAVTGASTLGVLSVTASGTVATFSDSGSGRNWRFSSGNLTPLSNNVSSLGGSGARISTGYFTNLDASGTLKTGSYTAAAAIASSHASAVAAGVGAQTFISDTGKAAWAHGSPAVWKYADGTTVT